MSADMCADDGVPLPGEARRAEVDALFATEMAAGKLAFRVAVAPDGAIIACAGGLLRTEYVVPLSTEQVPFGWVVVVYTMPEHRGHGLATRLTTEVCKWLEQQGARRARLWASSAGRPVYERLGFRPMFDMAKPLGGQ
jgi:GNAT superfamily N-acetyltransferase